MVEYEATDVPGERERDRCYFDKLPLHGMDPNADYTNNIHANSTLLVNRLQALTRSQHTATASSVLFHPLKPAAGSFTSSPKCICLPTSPSTPSRQQPRGPSAQTHKSSGASNSKVGPRAIEWSAVEDTACLALPCVPHPAAVVPVMLAGCSSRSALPTPARQPPLRCRALC